MLLGTPWLIAHRSMLQPNQPMKLSLYGHDYVLWQNRNGKVSCLPNACPHMGAMLSEGWCIESSDGSSSLVCPYHALEFDGAGCTRLPASNQKTLPLLQPLELIVQGNFLWSYGGCEPKSPLPTRLNEIAASYEFLGCAADLSIQTDLLTMLLNMHDYNHHNGAHHQLFKIQQVQLERFVDLGLHSHAYFNLPRVNPTLGDILKNPALLILPKVIQIHLENFFPSLVIVHLELAYRDKPIISIRECHVFVPESENRTRTYVLMFSKAHHPIAHLLKPNLLHLAEVFVKQDADILNKLYANIPARIKLNNEVGIDWVRRNFQSFPQVVEPNFSRLKL